MTQTSAKSSAPPPNFTERTYALGIGGYSTLDTILQLWLQFYFVPPPDRGVRFLDPQTFGLAVLVGRFMEALTHPLAGYGSDRLGKPWLFLLFGTVIFGGCGIALFYSAVPGEALRNTVLLFALFSVACIGQACYAVPYLGLIPKVAPEALRRLRLTNTQAIIILLGVLTGQVLSGFALNALNNNLSLMVTLFMTVAVGLMLLPLPAVRTLSTQGAGASFSPKEMLGILQRSPGFRSLVLGQFLFWLGFNMVRAVAIYYVTVLLRLPEGDLALYLGGIFLVALPSFLVVRWLTPKLGKRQMMILATGLFALFLPLLSSIGHAVGPIPANVWAFSILAINGFPLAILSAVPNPMVADQIDQDDLATGQAKGALFFGVQGLVVKISVGLAGALLGFLLNNFGYSQEQPLGILLVGPIAGVLSLGSAIAYSFYPKEEPE
jgi:glycoside/pentoside/hexuronide:cation symporter, GPH family